jgi:DNA invertase Pin-like site-specific DNA recombinase
VTQLKTRMAAALGRLIGYARVSTEEQGTDPQRDELGAAGCDTILEEHASGADRTRPVLARLLRDIRPGETLVVIRLDRLARSVSHLLNVIEQLETKGAHFRSLRDPIDTTTPQGMFSLQVLGAVAQLERALIAERTKAGLSAARSRGRIGGNPGLRAGDPEAIRKLRAGRDAAHLDGILARLDSWLPTVRRMRPAQPWGDVVRVLNRAADGSWTAERLRRTVRLLVTEGIVEATLMGRAPRQPGDDRLVRLVAGIARRHRTARCSKSPPSSRPCASAPRAAEHAGTPPRSGTCSREQSSSDWPGCRQRMSISPSGGNRSPAGQAGETPSRAISPIMSLGPAR